MAKNVKTATTDPVVNVSTEAKESVVAAPAEDEYPISELVAAAKPVFGVPREVVKAALRNAKQNMTVSEAKKIINEFLTKEVI